MVNPITSISGWDLTSRYLRYRQIIHPIRIDMYRVMFDAVIWMEPHLLTRNEHKLEGQWRSWKEWKQFEAQALYYAFICANLQRLFLRFLLNLQLLNWKPWSVLSFFFFIEMITLACVKTPRSSHFSVSINSECIKAFSIHQDGAKQTHFRVNPWNVGEEDLIYWCKCK